MAQGALEVQFKTTEKYTQRCIDEILKVARKDGLTAENIIARAEKESNPLHKFFEWDDSIAAHQHRLHQARVLINEITIIIEDVEYPAFENVRVSISEDESERIYKTRQEVVEMAEYRQQMVARALNLMLYWKKQYESFSELQPIFTLVEKTKVQLEEEWQKKTQ